VELFNIINTNKARFCVKKYKSLHLYKGTSSLVNMITRMYTWFVCLLLFVCLVFLLVCFLFFVFFVFFNFDFLFALKRGDLICSRKVSNICSTSRTRYPEVSQGWNKEDGNKQNINCIFEQRKTKTKNKTKQNRRRTDTIMVKAKKDKRPNTKLQNIYRKLKIGQHEPH
jgi:anionic cell wall polymer biosynthesis LytR-Cps2A-Psr (LCP) family protein